MSGVVVSLSPHRKHDPGSIHGLGLSEFACSPFVRVGYLQVLYSCFLPPPPKNMHIRSIDDSKNASRSESKCGWLFVSVCPWDRLQSHRDPLSPFTTGCIPKLYPLFLLQVHCNTDWVTNNE